MVDQKLSGKMVVSSPQCSERFVICEDDIHKMGHGSGKISKSSQTRESVVFLALYLAINRIFQSRNSQYDRLVWWVFSYVRPGVLHSCRGCLQHEWKIALGTCHQQTFTGDVFPKNFFSVDLNGGTCLSPKELVQSQHKSCSQSFIIFVSLGETRCCCKVFSVRGIWKNVGVLYPLNQMILIHVSVLAFVVMLCSSKLSIWLFESNWHYCTNAHACPWGCG